jgi:hypothetical protein
MQLALYEAGQADRVNQADEPKPSSSQQAHRPYSPHSPHSAQLCAACRAREARYGFRPAHEDDPTVERPRTLCFECFRMEMDRRRMVAAQLARGWNATQAKLPLADRLETLARRRGRAQIAARHALDLR